MLQKIKAIKFGVLLETRQHPLTRSYCSPVHTVVTSVSSDPVTSGQVKFLHVTPGTLHGHNFQLLSPIRGFGEVNLPHLGKVKRS